MRRYLSTALAEHGADADLPEARELALSIVARTSTVNAHRELGLISLAMCVCARAISAHVELAQLGKELGA